MFKLCEIFFFFFRRDVLLNSKSRMGTSIISVSLHIFSLMISLQTNHRCLQRDLGGFGDIRCCFILEFLRFLIRLSELGLA